MKKVLSLFLCFTWVTLSAQQKGLDYYFPNEKFDPSIPTPAEVLGFEIGTWHVSHTQLLMYMKELARASKKVEYKEFARTYEQRSLIMLTISAKQNLDNIEKIRKNHLAYIFGNKKEKKENHPVILYQGYSIHGNEASGANAAILYAYYLAASQSLEVKEYLQNAIVLLDPCFNPDGFQRFSTWVNQHKNKNLTADPNDREYREVYPGGRTNHYWFDLNRDWLPVRHPESQGRIKNFHQWFPNILTDHHEMGTHNTFFFQPGIPSRTNPITPIKNQELTAKIGNFHAAALDKVGSLYYAKESFDDFYYGKGSTYPDVKGSIGILFEQASSRGHLQESDNGLLSFPFTIRNQLLTSISTLKAGVTLKDELQAYQHSFYSTALALAKRSNFSHYVFSSPKDFKKTEVFLDILEQHQVQYFKLKSDKSIHNQKFIASESFAVPLVQPQYRLVKAIFEKTTQFPDSLFYDVSAWTLPLAFNLQYAEANLSANELEKYTAKKARQKLSIVKSEYAYLLDWKDYDSPAALYALQKAGVHTKVLQQKVKYKKEDKTFSFDEGSILIPVYNNQASTGEELFQLVNEINQKYQVQITSIATGNTEGVMLGSPNVKNLKKENFLLVMGRGVSAYDVGEIWHLLDQRYDVPVTMVASDRIGAIDLSKYTSIIFPSGSYYNLKGEKELKDWLHKGGQLILLREAIKWGKQNHIANVDFVNYLRPVRNYRDKNAYKDRRTKNGAQVIGGAIFNTQADLSHPLLYGYESENIPVFHKGTLFIKTGNNDYANPLVYTNHPVLSGYISKENLRKLRNSAALSINRFGKGKVISIVPNLNFRAFWYGTNKLFANTLFFGQIIERGSMNPPLSIPKD